MDLKHKNVGLYTDLYELIMAQGYFLDDRHNIKSSFDYFVRTNPFEGGYIIFAGLADLLNLIENFKYSESDCEYLKSIGFHQKFVEYLKNFECHIDMYAPKEGEVVFPIEPIVRVEGKLIETQLVESMVLNILNFESLIATKASRIRNVAGGALIADFGLRRAQGPASLLASRACIIGGFDATSNVMSAKQNGLKPVGTQAHSWIQSFDNELMAFREFAKHYPDKCILLVDTYNTLRSGIPNAIIVAKEMEQRNLKLEGVRLDSGDLAYLSKNARKLLDEAGLDYVKIVASNQLDEFVIGSLAEQGAKLDVFGVGTNVITGHPDGSLDGVYKLSMIDNKPSMKLSENREKMNLPGAKKILRLLDDKNQFYADAIVMEDENQVEALLHPFRNEQRVNVSNLKSENLMSRVMEEGQGLIAEKDIVEISGYCKKRLGALPSEHKRFVNPHIYKVGVTQKLLDLQNQTLKEIKDKIQSQKK